MRYFLWVAILFVSQFTNGQNVFTKFDVLVTAEEFDKINDNWEQRFTPTELITSQNNRYLMKRNSNLGFSTAIPKNVKTLKNAQISMSFLLENKSPNSGGVLLYANATGSSAIFIEINEKGKMRVKKLSETGISIISGTKNEGWFKTKGFKKNAYNNLVIKAENGYFDIYLNERFQRGFADFELRNGRMGLYVNASSQMEVDYFSIYSNAVEQQETPKEEVKKDNSMDDVLLLFRNKIEIQQKEILKLQNELNACKQSAGIDTAARKTNKTLEIKNQELSKQIVKLESDLKSVNKKLEYLESMKADLERSNNGDLLISLTELLAKEKKAAAAAIAENEKNKTELFILQKQVEELKYKLLLLEKQ